jgi:hypothetical protein
VKVELGGIQRALLALSVLTAASAMCHAQPEIKPQPATAAILAAFRSHDIVMVGEGHGNKQEYDWLRLLIATPEFADRVDDIVMEFGNSLYQNLVDRYTQGEDVPLDDVQRAWRDTVAAVGPPSPVYASLYQAVRETNLQRKGTHQLRVLCGDPNIDWQQVTEGRDILPFLGTREQTYARVVKDQVLAKHHHALLIMGAFHFLRHFDLMPSRKQFDIERELRAHGANPYLIVVGTNTTGGPEGLDRRFDSWAAPVIVPLNGSWVGDLPAIPVVTEGHGPPLQAPTLKDAADALLYLGPRDSLVVVQMTPAELQGTPYGKELERRQRLQMSLEK